MTETSHGWWGELRHGGVLIAPALLDEFFPTLTPLPEGPYQQLRRAWLRYEAFASDETRARREWIDMVLEDFLGLTGWQKGPRVDDRFKGTSPTGELLRPDRVLVDDADAALAVVIDDAKQVGVGRGRRAYARTVELLRATGIPLGLLTNGRQLRLVHAGPDYDAWAEWEAEAWFDEGPGREQLEGLLTLCGDIALGGPAGDRLTDAVRASRDRQGDLALVLGEQVRRAVELLLEAVDTTLQRDPELLLRVAKDPRTGARLPDDPVLRALYQAATRIVMRLVVVLYAEARDLLPRSSSPVYAASYSAEGLYHRLTTAQHHGGDAGLADRHTGWPQLLSLFGIIHGGSGHEAMVVRPYGGALFRPGDLDDHDAVRRALAALEFTPVDDIIVLRILRLLKVGRLRARVGGNHTWVAGPVDFSDLRTEYIGIVYEGLLDYELKRASKDDAVVFLRLGRQPALPLRRLEAMSDGDLRDLLKKLRKDRPAGPASEPEDSDGDDAEGQTEDQERPEDEGEDELAGGVSLEEPGREPTELRRRAVRWAERAVEVGRMVRRPRGRGADLVAFERQRTDAAEQLVERVVEPGRLYLAAWGGLRKGSGTFYTRPPLAVPTAHRVLEALCYQSSDSGLRPRKPDHLLALKVCDPAMGSGSFLVAALRYITEALAQSLVAHGHVATRGDEAVVTLPFGRKATAELEEELLPVPPDHESFDALLRTRLARHVVERCIYGVDLSPMAVELARLSLWVETLDPELPFEFLDHKLKCGNSLVGCWLHLVADYPARAWERQGGDGDRGDHTGWIKRIYRERVKPELAEWIRHLSGTRRLFDDLPEPPVDLVATLRARIERLHDLPAEYREEAYREIVDSDGYRAVKRVMDRWCSVWFWPANTDQVLTPALWNDPPEAVDEVVDDIVDRHRFFHWELEFPDVFRPDRPGFDAILGNPPWDVAKPNSKEFFSNHDPLYRTYGKQAAVRVQRQLFDADDLIEASWIDYRAVFKATSNFVKWSAEPFRASLGRGGASLLTAWERARVERPSLASSEHPYRRQGSADLNTYKMFLEVSHHLLADGGRLGMMAPSGVWTDKGTSELRRLFLDRCRWEWCYGFENRRTIFPIHRSFKFAPVIIERGGSTRDIQVAFMRHDVGEWQRRNPPALSLEIGDVRRFAPETLAFLEIKDRDDLRIAEKIYADWSLLGQVVADLGGRYSPEFHMTNDSRFFVSRRRLERDGLIDPRADTRDPRVRARLWVEGYACLYEGKCFWIYDPYFAQPTAFVEHETISEKCGSDAWRSPRMCTRNVARSTDQRTLPTGLLPPCVHGNSAPSLDGLSTEDAINLKALMSSLVLDYILRMKVSANLNWFILETLPIAHTDGRSSFAQRAAELAWRLNALGADFDTPAEDPFIDPAERLVARLLLDALVADVYRLEPSEFAHIAIRFPIYDQDAGDLRYPNLALQVFRVLHAEGTARADEEARRLAEQRRMAGVSFGLDEVYVPAGGWTIANREARRIYREG